MDRYAGDSASHIRVDSSTDVADLIASGVGIGVTTCLKGDANPSLVRVFSEPVAFMPCYIVYHESLRSSARVRTMVDLLTEFLKLREPQFSGRGGPPVFGPDDETIVLS